MKSDEEYEWVNKDATPLAVRHADVARWSEESHYKSDCPIKGCPGALLMGRNQETHELRSHDYCVLCAQRVVYLDIDELRERLG